MDGNIVVRKNREVSRTPLQRRFTRAVEIEMGGMAAVTAAGFRQVFGCDPQYVREIYRDGQCVAVECTGDVAVPT